MALPYSATLKVWRKLGSVFLHERTAYWLSEAQ